MWSRFKTCHHVKLWKVSTHESFHMYSCIRTSEEGLLSVVLLETTKEITGYTCGVNTFLHHVHSFYSRMCMSCVPSRPPGLPQRGPGETAKTCIANYLPRYVIQSGPRIFRFANPFWKERRDFIKALHKLLPSKNPANYFLRRNRNFALPLCKTSRCKKSFIFSHVFCA